MKESGILMPVSALPSRTGIGELGAQTREFLKLLRENKVTIWQLLPLNPVGYGNSPYQPYSSFAGDPVYISLDELYEEGLLLERPPALRQNARTVDYEGVRSWKEEYLRSAFLKFSSNADAEQKDAGYQEFEKQKWVQNYGVFQAFRKKNGGLCWNEWTEEERNWPENQYPLSDELEEEARYQIFVQYLFHHQWMKIKRTANDLGVRIMGDVPFYVGLDSADVWAGKDNFLLDTDGRPVFIAGVPPDYFSKTGQRWGNPIYDWEKLQKDDYKFWVERIGCSNQMFDLVRIDHFRAFDTFWKIPASCPTAIEGEWVEAPGYEVLDTLYEKLPGIQLVAEDLGLLRPEVLTLRDHYHLKGMKILVFSIDTNGKYAYDREEDRENMIFYTGTHDNDTLRQWYEGLTCPARRKVRRFLARQGIRQGSVQDRLLAYIWKSCAEYVIVPMADILGLGKEGHLNTPGTVGSPNWEWRMPDMARLKSGLSKYRVGLSRKACKEPKRR